MCGIAGIVSDHRNLDKVVSGIMTSLIHRGPDFQSKFIKKNLALAHTRLSIIDTNERANQPMIDTSSKYTIVYNGEIYNFLDLKKEMINDDIFFKTNSDTEVILNGYRDYGIKFFKKLRGFYSFCIFNHEENSLILARDQLGKKPLYYSQVNSEFIFASEIKPLINAIENKQNINLDNISHYLWKGYYAHGETIYSSVKSILPGEIAKFDISLKSLTRISLDKFKISVSNSFPNRNLNLVKSSLLESLKYRFISDVPVAMLLSGGVDSSLLTLLAGDDLGKKFNTYYMGYDENNDIFRDASEDIANQIGSKHKSLIMKEPSINTAADKMIDIFGEPFADFSALPSYDLYESVSKHSKVVIAGDGADEMFGGYKDTKIFLIFDILTRILPNIKTNNGLNKIYHLLNLNNKSLNLLAYFISPSILPEKYFATITHNKGWNSLYRKEYMTEFGYKVSRETNVEMEESDLFLKSGETLIERYMNYYLIRLIYDFMVKVDRTSMANSIEVRSPYLDLKMMEKMNGMNISSMSNIFETKIELKKLLSSKGLNNISRIKKVGFTPPINKWMCTNSGISMLDTMTNDKNSIVSELFNTSMLKELYINKKNLQKNTSRLWNLLVLYKWSLRN